MPNKVATKLIDLLPDVLIEAQRCDAITAERSLQRTVEDLAYNHNLFRVWTTRAYDEKTPQFGPEPTRTLGKVFTVDDLSVLDVREAIIDGDPRACDSATYESGQLFVISRRWKDDGGEVRFLLTVMPLIDATVFPPSTLTRDRLLIINGTLADLFSMPNKAWSDERRGALYLARFQEALESWKNRELALDKGTYPTLGYGHFRYL